MYIYIYHIYTPIIWDNDDSWISGYRIFLDKSLEFGLTNMGRLRGNKGGTQPRTDMDQSLGPMVSIQRRVHGSIFLGFGIKAIKQPSCFPSKVFQSYIQILPTNIES